MLNNIVIIGATSEMAYQLAVLFAKKNCNLFLVGRNPQKMEVIASDLRCRTQGSVMTELMDMNDYGAHSALLIKAQQALGRIDLLFMAHGSLSDQHRCEISSSAMCHEFQTNCLSALSLLTVFADYFEQQKQGFMAVISSVAGDRGRKSNYIYGAAKGAVSLFLQGLRMRLAPSNVSVLTIKPGYVDTPMTAHLQKGLLCCSSQYAAREIMKAIENKKSVVYVPFFWRYIMLLIKCMPERVLSLRFLSKLN